MSDEPLPSNFKTVSIIAFTLVALAIVGTGLIITTAILEMTQSTPVYSPAYKYFRQSAPVFVPTAIVSEVLALITLLISRFVFPAVIRRGTLWRFSSNIALTLLFVLGALFLVALVVGGSV